MMNWLSLLVIVVALTTTTINGVHGLGDIIFALNAGGDSYTDSLGIRYRRDYLTEGTASDYGRALDIKRVPQQDKILYQTERYSAETFGYTIAMPSGDGDYVLWLKFSEVWFNAPGQKVFDISLNDQVVVENLDIFGKVGRGVAHDEIVPFQIRQNKVIVNGKASALSPSGEIRVDFIKTDRDNPKVNALVVMRGTPDQVPRLMPYTPPKQPTYEDFEDGDEEEGGQQQHRQQQEDSEDEDEEEIRMKRAQLRARREQMERGGESDGGERTTNSNKKPRSLNDDDGELNIVNPYEADETSYFIPILVAIGAFIPLLFCLCKL